ncbi:MAG: L-threonylcarbamoyladenylate synthase [Chloroflexota bacterium]|nr:L-threonylcarbamoyladenylate synthase [Chloroflexota bacterium]
MVEARFSTEEEIIKALKSGQIAGIPTDTVYGLAADPLSSNALKNLSEVKGRNTNQPIAVLFSELSKLDSYIENLDQLRRIELFWPGALTAIVRAKRDRLVAPLVTDELTIGIRKPANEITIRILERMGGFLAVTSANRHDRKPANSAQEVADIFGDQIPVFDGGVSLHGVASTVVDFTDDIPRLVRQGAIEFEEVVTTWTTN